MNFFRAVWKKAEEVYDIDARIWRKDFPGAWIRYDHYGMKNYLVGKLIIRSHKHKVETGQRQIFSRFSGKIIWKNQMIILFLVQKSHKG